MPQHNTPAGAFSYPDAKSIYPAFPRVSFGRAVAIGIGTGFVGAMVMAGGSKIEQLLTNRPNSYVPGRTIATHLGLSSFYSRHPDILNHVHHLTMGMVAGPIRAICSYYGIIGPIASFAFTGIRILIDQTVEISAGVSTWPWTWPINEQVVDLLHKGVYGIVVGYLCDRLVRGVDWFN